MSRVEIRDLGELGAVVTYPLGATYQVRLAGNGRQPPWALNERAANRLKSVKARGAITGKTIMDAAVSLDGFIADDNDDPGPLFDWYGNGDVTWGFPGSDREARSTQASADFMRSHYRNLAAMVIGRRVFDLTNGWDGRPPAGEHVFVVTHQAPTD